MSTLSVESAPPPPSWLASISPTALVRVQPGPLLPITAAAAAGLAWGSVVVLGLTELSLLWVLLAAVAGLGAVLLAVRGNPMVGLVPLLAGGVLWGLATGDQLPASPRDVLGDLRLLGWNVAYALPLLCAYVAAVWVDARWQAYARVRDGAANRRWWGARGGDPDRQLGLLEAIPATRFVVASDGTALVLAGRRVAVVRTTTWPPGEYTVADDRGEVRRDGRAFDPGTDDMRAVAADVKAWAERLGGVDAQCRGFVLVHAVGDHPADEALVDDQAVGAAVRLVPEHEFVEVVGAFLAAEPYRVDIAVLQLVDERLQLFAAA